MLGNLIPHTPPTNYVQVENKAHESLPPKNFIDNSTKTNETSQLLVGPPKYA